MIIYTRTNRKDEDAIREAYGCIPFVVHRPLGFPGRKITQFYTEVIDDTKPGPVRELEGGQCAFFRQGATPKVGIHITDIDKLRDNKDHFLSQFPEQQAAVEAALQPRIAHRLISMLGRIHTTRSPANG